jgi:uncharacterized lipoprotein YajG
MAKNEYSGKYQIQNLTELKTMKLIKSLGITISCLLLTNCDNPQQTGTSNNKVI